MYARPVPCPVDSVHAVWTRHVWCVQKGDVLCPHSGCAVPIQTARVLCPDSTCPVPTCHARVDSTCAVFTQHMPCHGTARSSRHKLKYCIQHGTEFWARRILDPARHGMAWNITDTFRPWLMLPLPRRTAPMEIVEP